MHHVGIYCTWVIVHSYRVINDIIVSLVNICIRYNITYDNMADIISIPCNYTNELLPNHKRRNALSGFH